MTPETPDPPPVSPDPWEELSRAISTHALSARSAREVLAAMATARTQVDAARAADALRHQQEIETLQHTVNDYRVGSRNAEAEITQLSAKLSTAEATIAACAPFLKDGETPAACIARNRADTDAVLSLLAQEKATIANLTKRLAAQAKTIEAYQSNNTSLTAQMGEAHDAAAGFKMHNDDLRATVATLRAERDALKASVASLWASSPCECWPGHTCNACTIYNAALAPRPQEPEKGGV